MNYYCAHCKKRLSVVSEYRCLDCELHFCLKHRLPEIHECIGLENRQKRERDELMKHLSSSLPDDNRLSKIL